MIELTEQQRQELSKTESVVIDPQTRKEYVLVHREVYTRMCAIFDEEGPDMRAVGVLVDRAMREEDEGDPTLAFYQEKYRRKP
jgi:aminoglycoside/choline kinase family phosphotransferase